HLALGNRFAWAKIRLAPRRPPRIRRLFPVAWRDRSSVLPARRGLVPESRRVGRSIELLSSYEGYLSIWVIQSFTLRRSRPCVDLRLATIAGSEGCLVLIV